MIRLMVVLFSILAGSRANQCNLPSKPPFKLFPPSNYRAYLADTLRIEEEKNQGIVNPQRKEFMIKTKTWCDKLEGYAAISSVEMCLQAAKSLRAINDETCEDTGPIFCGRNESATPEPCQQCGAYLNPINCLTTTGNCNGLEAVHACDDICEDYYDLYKIAPFKDDEFFFNAFYRTYSDTKKCVRKSVGWLKKEAWEIAWPRCRIEERDLCLSKCPSWPSLNGSLPHVFNVTVCGNATEPEVEQTHEQQDTHSYPHDDEWPYGCYILEGEDASSPAQLKFNPNKASAAPCTDSGDFVGSARCICARADVAAGIVEGPPKKTKLYDGPPFPRIECFGNGWCGEAIYNRATRRNLRTSLTIGLFAMFIIGFLTL